MSLIKDDKTTCLDALSVAATETCTVYEDLVGRIEDPQLQALVREHAVLQRSIQETVEDLRRAAGELPQAGDPERGHFGAAGAYVRALVLPGDTTTHFIESLRAASARMSACLDDALALELDAPVKPLLERWRQANAAFDAALRAQL